MNDTKKHTLWGDMQLALFWCTTPGHDEDWFMVSRNAAEAAEAHECDEGFARGEAAAQFVCSIPDELQPGLEEGYPDQAFIEALGGEFIVQAPDWNVALRAIMGSGKRVVRFGAQYYVEGDIVDSVLREMELEQQN